MMKWHTIIIVSIALFFVTLWTFPIQAQSSADEVEPPTKERQIGRSDEGWEEDNSDIPQAPDLPDLPSGPCTGWSGGVSAGFVGGSFGIGAASSDEQCTLRANVGL